MKLYWQSNNGHYFRQADTGRQRTPLKKIKICQRLNDVDKATIDIIYTRRQQNRGQTPHKNKEAIDEMVSETSLFHTSI